MLADPEFAGGFGPFRPEWIAPGWRRLRMPVLAVTGTEPDAWRLSDTIVEERLTHVPDVRWERVPGAGHFVHMERPRELADLLLEFLAP